ncbi:MAG TPA: hypothetical protein V6D10_24595 [Trichocoleus sp.]
METSRGEKLFAAVLTLLTVGSVISLTYFLVAAAPPPTTTEVRSQQ